MANFTFSIKRKKIKLYLESVAETQRTVFDNILNNYINGELNQELEQIGIKKITIHIDWLPDYKCINIQGKYDELYVDIQIEPNEFSIGCDSVEPDEHTSYLLESRNQLYSVVKSELCKENEV